MISNWTRAHPYTSKGFYSGLSALYTNRVFNQRNPRYKCPDSLRIPKGFAKYIDNSYPCLQMVLESPDMRAFQDQPNNSTIWIRRRWNITTAIWYWTFVFLIIALVWNLDWYHQRSSQSHKIRLQCMVGDTDILRIDTGNLTEMECCCKEFLLEECNGDNNRCYIECGMFCPLSWCNQESRASHSLGVHFTV